MKTEWAQWVLGGADGTMDVLLDSGAFTAFSTGEEICLAEYVDFLDKFGDRFSEYVALDCIGDDRGTRRNLEEMLRLGHTPIPVLTHTDSDKRMDELYTLSSKICLGGLVRKGAKTGLIKRYLAQRSKAVAGRPVHWLGFAKTPMIARHRPSSVDASTWVNPSRFGQCALYLGSGKFVWLTSGKLPARPSVAVLSAVERSGVTWKELRKDSAWRSVGGGPGAALTVSADSWLRFDADLSATFGTRMHLVEMGIKGQSGVLDSAAANIRKEMENEDSSDS